MKRSKTIPLIKANLKGFMRDWESIALLIGFPLLIIALIFGSFSPSSAELPIGIVDKTDDFDKERFKAASNGVSTILEYQDISKCIEEAREYEIYGCVEVTQQENSSQYIIEVHYEDTKEIVGQRVTANIKQASNKMDLAYSKQKASRVLSEVRRITDQIEEVQQDIRQTNRELKSQIDQIDRKIVELEMTRANLKNELDAMDQDVDESEEDLQEFNETRREFYTESKARIENMKTTLNEIDEQSNDSIEKVDESRQMLEESENELEAYNEEISREIQDINLLIRSYEDFSGESRQYVARINETIRDLKNTKERLKKYRRDLNETDQQLEEMQVEYSRAEDMEAEEVASSISVENKPIYASSPVGLDSNSGKSGLNLITLQTMYSTLLLLVTLFVSLLVSKFITLNQINSDSKKRLDVMQSVFLPEYISVFVSSMVIITVPVFCVLAFGNYFFKLPIFENIQQIGLVAFLLCSAIVNMGIGIAYFIKDESITLLIGSFLMVFLIFFSGFVLPIEMMTDVSGLVASILPGTVAQKAFDLTVLYSQPINDILPELAILSGWSLAFGVFALSIKKFKRI